MLCQYKDIFGIPKEGVHSLQFLNTAVVDYVLTIALAALFAYATGIPWVISTILMFCLAIVMHTIFCVPTNSVEFLGLGVKNTSQD